MSCRGQGPGLGYRGDFQISQGYVGDILGTLCPFDPEMGEAVVHRIMSLTSAVCVGGAGTTHNQWLFPYSLPRKCHRKRGLPSSIDITARSCWASGKWFMAT